MDKTKLKGVAALIAAAVAVILAAFLCMSFPMAEVHAAEYDVSDGPSLVCHMAEAQEGDIIRLQDSITIDLTDEATVQSMYGGRVEANKDLYLSADTTYPAQSQTLDLNGHTLTIITGYTRCFSLTGDVTLTIIDSSAERTGAIVGQSNGSLFYSKTAESSLVLQDVAVKFTEYTEGGASITPTSAVIDTVGDVTLNNVTYTPAEGGPALIGDNAGAQVPHVADTAEKLAAAVADSRYSTVMLGADITQNITVEAGRTLTLDLNGYTLTAAAVDEKAVVSNYGTLTIVNTGTANTGAIQSADGSTWYTVFNEGTMTIGAEGEGYGELEVKNNSASNPASLVENNHDCSAEDPATLTIVSGTFTSMGNSSNAVKNDGYGICTIYGGTFTNEAEGGAAVMSAGTMTICGGTFVQESDAAISNVVRNTGVGSPVVIEGGSFTGELYNEGADGFAISGGTFDRTFSMTYLTDAVSVWFKDGDSAFIVAEEQPAGTTQAVAYIRGGVFYATLQDAINDVSDSFTKEISLAADAKESVTVPAGVEFDFRMSGYSLTSAKDSAPAMTVNGSVTWINEVTGTISGKSGVLVKNGGVAYIKESPTITFTGETNLSVEAGGEATVENGIFNGAIVNNGGTIELSGGTYAKKPESDWLAGGYGVIEQDGAYTVGLLYAEIAYMQGGQQVTEGFTDWAAAMQKLAELEGDITVTLYKTIGSGSAEFVVKAGQTVTLDQNGKLFSANIKNSGTLTITGSTGSVPGAAAEKLVNNGTLTIKGGKFNITSLENTGDLTIYGGSFGKSRELIVSMFAYLAEGVVVSAASNGYVTVKEAAAEAEVVCGDVAISCGSLSVAQSYSRYFAGDDTVTIRLLTDASISSLAFIGSAEPWTIDLNGSTLTVTSEYGLTFGSSSISDRSFTVTGGTIVLTTGDSGRYAVSVKYGATLTLDDINVEFAGTTPFADMINVDDGTLVIKSGNYYGGITRTNGTITIAEGCVFKEDIKDVLGGGLTQNESGMVVKDGAENAVAMIETETGFAYYDTLQAAITAAKDGDTITLLADVTVDTAITVDKAVTISGKGADGNYTVSTSAAAQVFNVTAAEGTVTFENITVKNTNAAMNASAVALSGGKAHAVFTNAVLDTSGAGKNSHPLFIGASSDGSDTTYNVTATGSAFKADTQGYAIQLIRKAELNISGSTLEGWAAVYTETSSSNASITIEQSKINGKAPDLSGMNNRFGVFALYGNYTKLTVENSTIDVSRKSNSSQSIYALLIFNSNNSKRCETSLRDNTITIGEKCTFSTGDGSMNNATASVSGGSINVPLNSKYIGSGSLAMNADGTYTVSEEPAVVQITHNYNNYYKFASLAQAFAAAESYDTITLLANTELNEQIRLQLEGYNTATLTFDLNGKTLTVGTGLGNTSAIWVGNGYTFTLEDSVGGGVIDGTHMDEESVVLSAMQATAKVIIEGGTIKVDTAKESCVFVKDGTLTIDGGAFINECKEEYAYKAGSPALAVNVNDSNTSGQHLIINGGTFVGRNPLLGDTNSNVTGSYMGSNVQVGLNAEGEFVAFTGSVPEGVASVYGLDESGALTVTVYTAEALAAALKEAAFADDTAATVILGKDITADVTVAEGREVTLDLGGHNLTNSGTAAGDHTIVNYGNLTVTGNGTVDNTVHQGGALVNYGVAILSGGTFTRSQEAGANGSANGNSWYTLKNYGHLTIKEGTTVTTRLEDETGKRVGTCSSLIANGYQNEKDHTNNSGKVTANVGNNATIVIEGGTFSGGINTVKNDEGGVATISGGTFTNVTQATVMNWNKLTISGGTFNVKDDAVIAVVSGCYTSDIGSSGETTITDGTFYGSITVDGAYGADVTYAISGGDFSVMPDYTYFEEGYAAAWDEDTGMYVTDSGDYVAAIENFGYTSLQAAINACGTDEATITLLADIVYGKNENSTAQYKGWTGGGGLYNAFYRIGSDQKITLDLNSKAIDFSELNPSSSAATLFFEIYGNLTVTGEGRMCVPEGAKQIPMVSFFYAAGGSTLKIENGTYESASAIIVDEVTKKDPSQTQVYGETNVTVLGGTFKGADLKMLSCGYITIYNGSVVIGAEGTENAPIFEEGSGTGFYSVLGQSKTAEGKDTALSVTVYGGSFGNAFCVDGTRGKDTSVAIEGGTFNDDVVLTGTKGSSIKGGTFNGTVTSDEEKFIGGSASFAQMPAYTYFAQDYIAVYDEETQMYVTEEGSWAAIVNDETGYGTLADALAAAKAGDTVVLQSDVTVTETLTIDKSITLDLNGNKIASSAEIAVRITSSAEVAARMTVEATIKNGTIIAEGGKQALAVAGAAAELNGVTVQGGTESAVKDLYLITVESGALTLDAAKVTLEFAAAEGASAQGQAIRSVNSDVTIRNNSAITSDGYGVTFRGALAIADAAKAETTDGFKTLTIENSSVTAYAFAVSGNGSKSSGSGTVIVVSGSTLESSAAAAIYHPQYGVLTIAGDGNTITGETGIEMRAGKLTVEGGTITATGDPFKADPNGNGSTTVGAAVAIVQHNTKQPIAVTLQGGTYAGARSVYEANLQKNEPEFIEKIGLAVTGGTYEGELVTEDLAAYVTGGNFAVRPSDEYFGEDFTAQYEGGYYVPVYSTALKEARIAAQTDVRAYAATLGFAWADIEAAATEGSEEAKLVLSTYNAIAEAASTLAVAEAKVKAFAAVEAYDEAVAKAEADAAAAFESYKAEQLEELNAALAGEDGTADDVVLPTATWFALNNAATQEEFDEYLANALAEVEAIRSLRTEISGQTGQLEELADALTAMSEGLFGTEGEGGTLTGGAFADLFDKVQTAIADAQDAIVNGTTGEDGATTSTSLASIQKYLEGAIKNTLDSISSALNDTTNGLAAIKSAIDKFDVSAELKGDFKAVTDAITAAQNTIMGAAGENAGMSIAGAVEKINEETAKLVNGLREALIGKDGTSGVLGTIAGYVDDLESMLGDEDSGLAAIVTNIKAAQAAIMGVTEEDKDGVSLSEVLGAVNTADGVIDDVLAAVQGLTSENGILTQIKSAVDGLTDLDIGGEFEDVLDAITNAQKAIMGATEESAGTSIAGAVTAITGVVNALTKEDGMVYAINETLKGLSEALTGTENNAFTALAKELKEAIIGTGDATLTEIASGVAGANKAIADVLAAVQALTDADNGIVAQVEAELAEMLGEIKTLTGALATSEQVKGIETGITDAKTEIDKIVAAIGSLGTGEGDDLATQIGGIVSEIEAVQGAIGEIGTNLGVAVEIEEAKADALKEIETWLNAYLDALLGGTEEADSGVLLMAVTLETEDGDLYGRLCEAFSEANAQLILKYYNQALTAIDNATSVTDASTAVSTFRAQVASVDAAAQNTPSMTGVYVLLAIVLVVLIAASIVVILKNRKAAVAVAAEPAAEAAAEEKPAEEAKPEAAEEAAEEGSETEESAEAEKPEAEEELAADDDDKEQVVIAANVRSFAEAYVELSDEQRELFNKVKEYALGKEGTSEAKLSSGVCVKLGSKQVVKLAVRRGNPVALFVLENEMLKDFRRGAATQAKLKVRATELVLREEADLETAYTMVDLSVDQIKKDAEAAKERRREQRRERRRQRLAEEAARQAEHDGSED